MVGKLKEKANLGLHLCMRRKRALGMKRAVWRADQAEKHSFREKTAAYVLGIHMVTTHFRQKAKFSV